MAKVDVFISESEISKRIDQIASEINSDYAGKEIVVIGVLNGSFIFAADLVRKINVPITMEFMAASSYGDGTESSGELDIKLDLRKDIRDKHVLIVEDIVDTGLTLSILREKLLDRRPASLKLVSLLFKPARNIHKVPIDYLAFEIEDNFVIGYGLDLAGRYRELPYIGIYHPED